MPELVVLGSAGWIPQDGMMSLSVALRFEDVLFVFDAGTGLARLGMEPHRRLLPPAGRPVHLFLSHVHLDHVVGLTFLPALWSNPTVVHFPAQEGQEAGTDGGAQVFDRVFGGPFFPLAFFELLPDISLEPVWPGETWVEGHRVTARTQPHPGGSLGYRVDDALAFVTDTDYEPAAADHARGVGILVNEAANRGESDASGGYEPEQNGHCTPEQAATTAKTAGVGELLLCHLPFADADCHARLLVRAQAIFPHTALCSDGLSRTIE